MHPDTFWIPSEHERQAIVPGMEVKLMVESKSSPGERMWVMVTKVGRRKLIGDLVNPPVFVPHLRPGDKIKFKRCHVIGTWYEEPGPPPTDGAEPEPSEVINDECQRLSNESCYLD